MLLDDEHPVLVLWIGSLRNDPGINFANLRQKIADSRIEPSPPMPTSRQSAELDSATLVATR